MILRLPTGRKINRLIDAESTSSASGLANANKSNGPCEAIEVWRILSADEKLVVYYGPQEQADFWDH